MPTALERAGDFSQTTDNNGNPYPVHQGSAADRRVHCGGPDRVLQRRRRARPDPGQPPVPDRPEHPEAVSAAEHRQLPAPSNYNFELTRPDESILALAAGAPPRLPADAERFARRSNTRRGCSATRRSSAPSPASTTRGCRPRRSSSWTTSRVNYTLQPDDVPRSDVRAQPERAGRLRAGAVGDRRDLLQQRGGAGRTRCRSRASAGLGGAAVPVPGRHRARPGLLRGRGARTEVEPPFWDGTRHVEGADFRRGAAASRTRRRTIGFPGWLNINTTQRLPDQPDQGHGPAHVQDRLLQHATATRPSRRSNNAFGTINFQQDAVGTNPFDTSFGFANAAHRHVQLVPAGAEYVETKSIYNNTEAYVQDNWKVNNRLTFDYGLRFVHQQPQYDKLGRPRTSFPRTGRLAPRRCCTSPAAPTACPPARAATARR